MHALRPYQTAAVASAIQEMRRSTAPILIEAATGAGKSLIIAEIARIIHESTGKRILVTAPSAELVVQDREKYAATGNPSSMFSASAGVKSLRHPVIFGTPGTIKNRISAFTKGDFALVVIDEGDLYTPTLRSIVDAMRTANPLLRVLFLTATPYRLGSGYIFSEWPDGALNGADKAREPYAGKCVYRITAPELIAEGYLCPPVIGAIHAAGGVYDTHSMLPNKMGKFASADVDRAYHGHGRKTAAIVADIVAQSQSRKGVLIYAATVQHAQEVLASLPPSLSAMVTGESADRNLILKRLKAQRLKYVVNVGVLTVGVDVPHVDVIAVLRKTDSIRLLQQIIGRGLRLSPETGKTDCLYLDYTSNVEDHCPDGDLFAPIVKAKALGETGGALEVECPECAYVNAFTANKDCLDYKLDAHGYCLDVWGQRVETDFGPMPGHHGRRCNGLVPTRRRGEYDRCGYRWTSKPCLACEAPNDIAARYCRECKAEIVDPGEKLIADFRALKRDPTQPQTDKVLSFTRQEPTLSRAGNPVVRADWQTEYRHFSTWHQPEATFAKARADWERFDEGTRYGTPETVSYVKNTTDNFYRLLAFNQEPDHAP